MMPSQVTYTGMLEPKVTREQIVVFQDSLIPHQVPMPDAKHHFAKGMYCREFPMKAGMVVVGKIHRHEHFMMVLKGHAWVVTEFGKQEVEAGLIHVSPPGAKRVVYATEDTIFATVHLNTSDTQDLAKIEDEHIEPESEHTQALMKEFAMGALS